MLLAHAMLRGCPRGRRNGAATLRGRRPAAGSLLLLLLQLARLAAGSADIGPAGEAPRAASREWVGASTRENGDRLEIAAAGAYCT